MLNRIFEWIKNLFKTKHFNKIKFKNLTAFNADTRNTKMYLHDPSVPDLIAEYDIGKSALPMMSKGEKLGNYSMGSIQQQASACRGMINSALTYILSKTPKKINRWATTNALNIVPRAGKDVNAYYDRGSLKFYYFGDNVLQKNIYACESRSVVVHEFGHAYLDILRPDLWSTQAAEVWAFHEAFGDMIAILENLQHDQLIQHAISETHGDIKKSNILTRLASEMGIGVFNLTKGKNGEPNNCLRDLSIKFNYTEPEKLPKEGPDNVIINECHSFSRILSSAFYEIIVDISKAKMLAGVEQITAIKDARDVMASYLISAVISMPLTVRLFDSFARQILLADKAAGGKYQQILIEIFSNRLILKQIIKMLDVKNIKEISKEIKNSFELTVYGKEKVIRTLDVKTIKINDGSQVMALNYNPLFDLEIEIPNQISYSFDENGNLIDVVQSLDTEIIDAAYTCLDYLHQNNLVGDHENALFTSNNGKLIRKQIVCKCRKPNYCDPNAPEYGKAWKPANNAGCTACRSNCEPQSCDCNPTPTTTTPPRVGCYTTVKTGSTKSYKVGQYLSRKVC